jgi:hypothetical protein
MWVLCHLWRISHSLGLPEFQTGNQAALLPPLHVQEATGTSLRRNDTATCLLVQTVATDRLEGGREQESNLPGTAGGPNRV